MHRTYCIFTALVLFHLGIQVNSATKTTFYHYTDKSGKNAIVRDKVVRQGNGAADARYGAGVYGTSLDPSTFCKKLAENDLGAVVNKGMQRKKAWAIKVKITDDEVEVVDRKRDILLYRGDLDLTNYHWTTEFVQCVNVTNI